MPCRGPDTWEDTSRINELTRLLCKVCRKYPDAPKTIRGLGPWWRKHQTLDRARKAVKRGDKRPRYIGGELVRVGDLAKYEHSHSLGTVERVEGAQIYMRMDNAIPHGRVSWFMGHWMSLVERGQKPKRKGKR